MILLPSRARPHKLARFFEAYAETRASEPGLLMLEERDVDSYKEVKLPDTWATVVVPESLVAKKFNDAATIYAPNEDFYFICADDLVPITEGWDRKLKEYSCGYYVTYGNDLIQGHKIPTHPCVPGGWVRELGYLANPIVGHFYFDNMIRDVCEPNNLLRYCPDIILRHEHFTITGDFDQACHERGSTDNDRIIYEIWRDSQMRSDIDKAKMFAYRHEAEFRHA